MHRLDDISAYMATRALDELEFANLLDAIPVPERWDYVFWNEGAVICIVNA
jgi:hypothetical protein